MPVLIVNPSVTLAFGGAGCLTLRLLSDNQQSGLETKKECSK